MYKKKKNKSNAGLMFAIVVIALICSFLGLGIEDLDALQSTTDTIEYSYEISNIPAYSDNLYIEINDNVPTFTSEDIDITEDYYSTLQDGKAGMAMIKTNYTKANEDDEKDDYSSIKPSGFVQKKYDTSIVPGGYLYHRCHIIAWKLGGVDVDTRNLMTGTQNFNVKGMKVFEDEVYNYLEDNQSNNVLYRVTPHYEDGNALASGVNIEAYSIEDDGVLQFNVYIYNVQDGITIDYSSGESSLAE